MISVLAPWFLLAALPAIGLLVWAYRNQGDGEKLVLGSLLLLEQLQERVVLRRKFVPPPRFFIELLIFLLIVAALSQVVFPSRTETFVIVVDNSESMRRVSSKGITLFEEVVGYVPKWLGITESSESGVVTRYRVISAAPNARELSSEPVTASEVPALLRSISPVAGPDKMKEAIYLASRYPDLEEILILSDKSVQVPALSEMVRVESQKPAIETLRNISIAGAQYERGRAGESGAIEVQIRSFSDLSEERTVVLSVVKTEGVLVERTQLRRATVTVAPFSEETIRFENISSDLPLYSLQLVSDPALSSDTLKADDTYWLFPDQRGSTIKVISKSSIEQLGLLSYPGLTFESLQEFSPISGQENLALYLTHNFAGALAELPGLHVLPARGTRNAGRGPVDAGGVISARSQHPVLDYVDLSTITFGEVLPLAVPEWAEPVIEVEAGVIAYMGLLDGKPMVVLGFELFPLQGEGTPMRSVLFLNILKWITSHGSGSFSSLSPGGKLSEELQGKEVFFADGKSSRFTSLGSDVSFFPPTRGVLRVNGELYGALQFFSSDEASSPLEKEVTISIPRRVQSTEASLIYSVNPLLWVSLLFLLIDLVLLATIPRYSNAVGG